MDRCFFGMKLEDSSTSVRISSGESLGSSVGLPGRIPRMRRSGRANRFTNQVTGLRSHITGFRM